jgi:hypothetical protein
MNAVSERMAPVWGRVRAYFAPVVRASDTPTIFDAGQIGGFALEMPPVPWIDLGWIDGFTRKCGTKVVALRGGAPATTQAQVRTELDATVSFAFESWGKVQMALSAGTQQMNLLAVQEGAAAAGSGGLAVPAVPLTAGSTATTLQVGASVAAGFAVGNLVAVDVDYAGTTGFVGAGLSGAYVKTALTDVDYVRRVTCNVGRISAVGSGPTAGALTLEAPLLAGVPTAAMKVSAVEGFCDREGSSFFQEWSGVFVGEGRQGERVLWHYPRLQAMAGIAEDVTGTLGGFEKARLAGVFRALPVVDPVDGETVACFRSYVTG